MVMLAKIWRMHLRDGVSLREVAKHTDLSRNTIKRWLRGGQSEPVYPRRCSPFRLDPYRAQLETWLRADSQRPRSDQRTTVRAVASRELSRHLHTGDGLRPLIGCD